MLFLLYNLFSAISNFLYISIFLFHVLSSSFLPPSLSFQKTKKASLKIRVSQEDISSKITERNPSTEYFFPLPLIISPIGTIMPSTLPIAKPPSRNSLLIDYLSLFKKIPQIPLTPSIPVHVYVEISVINPNNNLPLLSLTIIILIKNIHIFTFNHR